MRPLTWTPAKIAREASKHQTRSAFARAEPSAYLAARRMGILDLVCLHMPPFSLRLWERHQPAQPEVAP
jgi:hypothetical protein